MVGILPTTAHGISTISPRTTTRTDCTLQEVRLQKRRKRRGATPVTSTARKDGAQQNITIPQIMAALDGVHHPSPPHVLIDITVIVANLLPALASEMTKMMTTKQPRDTTPRRHMDTENQPLDPQHRAPLVPNPPGPPPHISTPPRPPPPAHGPLELNPPIQHHPVRLGPVPSAVCPTIPAKQSPTKPSSPKTLASSWTRTP